MGRSCKFGYRSSSTSSEAMSKTESDAKIRRISAKKFRRGGTPFGVRLLWVFAPEGDVMKSSLMVATTFAAVVTLHATQAQTFKVNRLSIGGDGSHDYIVAE